jgi:hypothetical protein
VQTEENNGTDAGQDDRVRSADEPEAIVTTKGKPLKRSVIIVDTDLRSPRIKGQKGGIKNPQCIDKNYLGCGAAPPALTPKVIKKLGSSLCNLDPGMTYATLTRKKKLHLWVSSLQWRLPKRRW